MKNKLVKKMICNVLNEKHAPTMEFEFERTISPIDYSTTEYGLHKDSRPFKCGTVSLTLQQLRETL